MTIKLSYIVYFLLIIITICLMFSNKESFSNKQFTGYAFFPRSILPKNSIEDNIKPYNGYKLLKEHDEYIPENGNLTILPKSTEFKYMKTDLDKNANGILDTNENNIQKQELDKIDKFTYNFIGKNIGQMLKLNDTQSDIKYIESLKSLFIKYLNKTNNLNFIALHYGDHDIINFLGLKKFVIPFFLYEATLNYTRTVTVKFDAKFNINDNLFDIFIENINNSQISELTLDTLKLSSATVNKNDTLFSGSILDTNGYYTIYNSLGLMFPFLTSPNTITNKTDLKLESEGPKINQDDFNKIINRFNPSLV